MFFVLETFTTEFVVQLSVIYKWASFCRVTICLWSIQVFHCLRHEGTGGRTLLVDGFHAADRVLQQTPEDFELLSRVPIKHEYIENLSGHRNHMIGIGPVLNVYPWNNEVYMIR